MSVPRSIASATRRLVALTALRWLPVGLLTPVLVLLAQERGLSLPQIGVLFVVHGAVIVVLELPTGGLADVVGRRPVLVVSAVLHLLSCLLLVVAGGLAGFLLASVVKGAGRALDSGPLEAWYVDTVQRLDPDADITPGLGWHGAADGGGLAAGAVIGGLLPGLVAAGGAEALVVPFVVAAVLDLVYLAALLPLVTEPRPPREGSALQAFRAGAADVPRTVAGAVRLSASDPPLRLVLLLTALGGVAIAGLELLGPVHFAALAGGTAEGAALFGVVLAASFGAAALGAVSAPRARRLARGSTRVACAVVTLLGALGVGALAGTEASVLAGVAFAVYYTAHGAGWPLLTAVSHSRVTAAHRSTTVSAISLAMALGGIGGSLLLPLVAQRTSTDTAFVVLGGVVLLTAGLCLRLPGAPVDRPLPARDAGRRLRPAARRQRPPGHPGPGDRRLPDGGHGGGPDPRPARTRHLSRGPTRSARRGPLAGDRSEGPGQERRAG